MRHARFAAAAVAGLLVITLPASADAATPPTASVPGAAPVADTAARSGTAATSETAARSGTAATSGNPGVRQEPAGVGALDPASVLSVLSVLSTLPPPGSGTWVPVPIPPQDFPAGRYCPFALHMEPTVNTAVSMVLATRPDGSTSRDAGIGAVIVRLTNPANGRTSDVDTSDSVVTDHHPDGSSSLYIFGPTLVGFRTDHGTLPRGLYQILGLYRIDINLAGDKILTMAFGTTVPLCDRLA